MHWLKSKVLVTAVVWALATATEVSKSPLSSFGPEVGYIPEPSPGCLRLPEFWRFTTRLSRHAEVYYEGSDEFANYTERWSNVGMPTPNITILPATQKDVVETVKFANRCSIPFLAYNGLHGALTTMAGMDWGIAINLRKLSSVEIQPGGNTVKIGGGTNSKVVIDTLWAAGKQTVTGTCECVSYMGPALGGGHGWLQGHYGLIADQFVSMTIVLADGSVKTINSQSDLWWAMRGAGHNFGIVTSVTSKIYPRIHTTYAIETLMFTGDKVAALYRAANDHLLKNGTQPVDIINWSYWFNVPPIDPTGPVIEFYIIQENATTVDSVYSAPFYALGPIAATPQTGDYRDVSRWTGISLDGPPCQKTGKANPRFPIYLRRYNATAQAELYARFAAATNASSPFAGSLFMFEGYSNQGVQSIAASSSAFAFRSDHLLLAPLIQYTPDGPALDAEAKALGNELRSILHQGSGRAQMHTYVNYAYGDEQKAEWYGHEKWRLDRLKALKRKYDPRGRFNFYAPAA
ncbi:hypothetical protein QBC34DRAFT_300590 [Podospora aff. communis PSN243]|uniref:FAD-binding PCMH-type domain-containing protein n=1 Tax=Podospora aff. communis PSN243 TaxID=3040156 RepID=A0AAV9GKU5_9PEZI|nr:hypothetical protein QBC34DRAFT_300590 [Podospora aff. communis PSN243]